MCRTTVVIPQFVAAGATLRAGRVDVVATILTAEHPGQLPIIPPM
jgi:hypothetical protein